MTSTIAYYHPRKIVRGSDRASDIRVEQMLKAFEQLGYDVHLIAGEPGERRASIRSFKKQVETGIEVAFVYGECTNAPIALAEKKLFPSNFIVDYQFFRWLKRSGIPNGIFYRDVHWRFKMFERFLPWPLNHLLKPAYYLDWFMYDRYWETFFLPSEAMNPYLPDPRSTGRFAALPPGCEDIQHPANDVNNRTSTNLQLLYVGGIEPSVYDLSTMLRTAAGRPEMSLTICCRKDEWQKHAATYKPLLGDRVTIVHPTREELADHYHRADLFLMLMPEIEYLDFAMPVKFFEVIGYAVPMVSMHQREVEEIIGRERIGWAISEPEQLADLLDDISNNRNELADKRENLLVYRHQCTWKTRARAVVNHLQKGLSGQGLSDSGDKTAR